MTTTEPVTKVKANLRSFQALLHARQVGYVVHVRMSYIHPGYHSGFRFYLWKTWNQIIKVIAKLRPFSTRDNTREVFHKRKLSSAFQIITPDFTRDIGYMDWGGMFYWSYLSSMFPMQWWVKKKLGSIWLSERERELISNKSRLQNTRPLICIWIAMFFRGCRSKKH